MFLFSFLLVVDHFVLTVVRNLRTTPSRLLLVVGFCESGLASLPIPDLFQPCRPTGRTIPVSQATPISHALQTLLNFETPSPQGNKNDILIAAELPVEFLWLVIPCRGIPDKSR